ncbi:MAG TPA: hypothetical protein VKW06_19325 [Candidatus Angelobacter sp.]|nr:hypothetical protein [Candidatus Angelobacter sp.]
MAFWGILLELARAVVPHAAPHVARAVVDAAKERRAGTGPRPASQPSNQSLADAISYLEGRLSSVEEKAVDLQEKLEAVEKHAAERWEYARKLAIGLLVWNGIVTAALLTIVIFMLVRH